MSDIAISVRNVSKCYRVFDNQRSRLLHAIWPRHVAGMQEVWALKEINFDIKRGEAVALIGRNGGGKSTLLEILTGTLTPTNGEVTVNGRVSALLELGSGFNPEYSGRDNVMLNGLLLGLSREEILGRFSEIEAFAEIGAAIDRPVKTYSSGMMMRLAFAVQVLCEPDILIIDEALSVGDFFFQQKCLRFIRGLCAKGVTLLFVSHDMGTVRDICSRSIYLKNGKLMQVGATSDVIAKYLSDANSIPDLNDTHGVPPTANGETSALQSLTADADLTKLFETAFWRNEDPAPDMEGKLLAVSLADENGIPAVTFEIGEVAVISIVYSSTLERECHAGINILNKFGHLITGISSYTSRAILPLSSGRRSGFKTIVCELRISMFLEAGQYSLEACCGVSDAPNRGSLLSKSPPLGPISIVWDYEQKVAPFLGQSGLPVDCRCYL